MKYLLTLSFILTPILLFSQGWERTYGGSGDDFGKCIQQTNDEGYIITGYTESYGVGNDDVYLIKTNSNGETLWTKTYGGINLDEGSSVQQTTDEGFIITGFTESYGSGNSDVYLIKTDNNGDTIWTKTFGGSENELGNSVQQTTDGGYIITGFTNSFGNGIWDVYLIKTDNNGDSLWTKTIGSYNWDKGRSVQQTTDGGFIITGFTNSFGSGGDVYLIKTDTNGDTLWTKTYGGSLMDEGRSVQQTTDGGYILTGYTESFSNGNRDVFLIKTNNTGDTLWTKTFGGIFWDIGFSVKQTNDSGYIITGWSDSFSDGDPDLLLIKTGKFGDVFWTKTFGGSEYDIGISVDETNDNGYIVTGNTNSFGMGTHQDVYVIKTDENGDVMFISDIPTPLSNRKLLKTIDFLGRDIQQQIHNRPFIEIYDDGSVKKKMILE